MFWLTFPLRNLTFLSCWGQHKAPWSIEEFVQLQSYMLLAEKDSEVYKAMKIRYSALKVILTSSGINLTEIDRIKE